VSRWACRHRVLRRRSECASMAGLGWSGAVLAAPAVTPGLRAGSSGFFGSSRRAAVGRSVAARNGFLLRSGHTGEHAGASL
jgi:hypothetical protein